MVEVLVHCNLVARKAFFPAKTLFAAPEDLRQVVGILFRPLDDNPYLEARVADNVEEIEFANA